MSFNGGKNIADGVYGIESDGFADPAHLSPGTNTSTTLGYLANVTSDIQTQINDRATVDSPAFTGTPTAPTPLGSDSSTTLATTAAILNKLLPGFYIFYANAVPILETDTIFEALQKLAAGAITSYSTLTTAESSYALPFHGFIRVTALGQTIILPEADGPGVRMGLPVYIEFPAGLTPGSIEVLTGYKLNYLTATPYTPAGSVTNTTVVGVVSDGMTGWRVVSESSLYPDPV